MNKQKLMAVVLTGIGSLLSGCAHGSVVRPQPLACDQLRAGERAQAEAALDSASWVGELYADRQLLKFSYRELTGVELYVPAGPGLTAPWLQRVASCRAAAHASISRGSSPFGLHGSHIEVRPAQHGFSVRIRHTDRERARELVRRAGQSHATL